MGAAAIPIALAVASVGAQQYNTRRTERKQDDALAQSIRNRSKEQQKIDARVNDEITSLEGSTSSDERAGALDSYSKQLQSRAGLVQSGGAPAVGSSAFKQDATARGAAVEGRALETAGLLSRVEAPTLQRQNESFGYGRLGTDVDLEARASRGNAYLDDMRLRQIRRNPWIDMAAQIGMSYAGGGLGAGMGGATGKAAGGVTAQGAGMSSAAGYAPYNVRSPGWY